MGTLSCRLILVAGLVAAMPWLPGLAATNDYGPAKAVAVIRHDLPLLLAAPLQDTRSRATIDWVVTDGQNAVAMWHAAGNAGVVALRLHSGRWWWRGAAVMTANEAGVWTPMSIPGNALSLCYHNGLKPRPPTAHGLFAQGFVDKVLADHLSRHDATAAPFRGPAPIVLCDPDLSYVDSRSEAYDATFFHRDDVGWKWFNLSGDTPPSSQRAAIPAAEPYYSFTLGAWSSDGDTPPAVLRFARGSTLEVWFPFVLPTDENYMLHLSGVIPEITELSGTLKNNVLRFVLPPLALKKGVIARGEIDGARY